MYKVTTVISKNYVIIRRRVCLLIELVARKLPGLFSKMYHIALKTDLEQSSLFLLSSAEDSILRSSYHLLNSFFDGIHVKVADGECPFPFRLPRNFRYFYNFFSRKASHLKQTKALHRCKGLCIGMILRLVGADLVVCNCEGCF